MPLDPSIPLQAKAPDPLQSMGQWLGLARAKQQLERETATLPTDIERSRAESDLARINAERARRTLDDYIRSQRAAADTATAGAKVATESAEADIRSRKAAATTAETGAQRAGFELAADQMQLIRNQTNRFLNDPDFDPAKPNRDRMIEKIADVRQELVDSGVPRPMAEAMTSRLIAQAASDPKSVRQSLLTAINAGLGAQGQAAAAVPGGPAISTGQQTAVINTNPMAGPVGRAVPGTVAQQQLPPTAQTVQEVAPGVYQPAFVGPQGGGIRPPGAPQAPAGMSTPTAPGSPAGASPAQPQRGFVPAGPPMGAEGNMAGVVEVVNRDRQQTNNDAAVAPRNIEVLQNIKKYATPAITGVGADRRSVVAGLGQLIGMESGETVKTATDLFNKYSAQLLMLSGGNSDLARSIAEAATPNNTMTDAAIHKVANQMIAVQQMAQAKARFLSPYQYSPVDYQRALQQFSAVASPALFEFRDASLPDKTKMLEAMPAADRRRFRDQIKTARELGLVK